MASGHLHVFNDDPVVVGCQRKRELRLSWKMFHQLPLNGLRRRRRARRDLADICFAHPRKHSQIGTHGEMKKPWEQW